MMQIACLLVLAVAAQAQFYGGYYSGYYPYAGVPATTAYTGIPATAAYPAAYGYPSFSATQYHAQDELGQASFGYAHPGQAATNLRDGLGNQIGSYAYINPEGKEVRVSYTADSRGFRVLSNDLPVAPVQVQDTPEVAQAKADHAAAVAAAKSATPAVRAKRQVFGFGAYPGYAVSPYAYTVAAPAVPTREATLTKTILTPGHAVAYRVD